MGCGESKEKEQPKKQAPPAAKAPPAKTAEKKTPAAPQTPPPAPTTESAAAAVAPEKEGDVKQKEGGAGAPVAEEKAVASAPPPETPTPREEEMSHTVPPLRMDCATPPPAAQKEPAARSPPPTVTLVPIAAKSPSAPQDESAYGRVMTPRRAPVEVPIRREGTHGNQALQEVVGTVFNGPGPSRDFPVEKVYRCFDEGNGLLFRLVNETRHTWAFYNDTEEYTMYITVTFGHESMVKALGITKQVIHDEETGHCTLELTVGPGETEPFMRGEYNGFVTAYDADPIPYEERKQTGKA